MFIDVSKRKNMRLGWKKQTENREREDVILKKIQAQTD